MRNIYEVIRRPIITEKSAALAEVGSKYAFEVDVKANKTEIKDAVQKLFNVRVTGVHTMIMHGKSKRFGSGIAQHSNWKKALVSLAAGEKIDFFKNQ
jgi:large subunit ribosomal protein L23